MKLSKVMAAVSMGLVLLPWVAQAACTAGTGIIQFQGSGMPLGPSGVCSRAIPFAVAPVRATPVPASDRWQEEHQGGPTSGPLWDYKMGRPFCGCA